MKHNTGMVAIILLMFSLPACTLLGGGEVSEEEIVLIQADVVEQQSYYDAQVEELLEEDLDAITSSQLPGRDVSQIQQHVIIPQNPGKPEQTLEDSVSYPSADEKRAVTGDNYSENLFERPFTAGDMQFQPWLDIQQAALSQDARFYYFTIELYQVDSTNDSLNGAYGVELDVDKDGRGDFLVWAFFPRADRWTTQRVVLLSDTNEDVGGPNPMLSDAVWKEGDGYETRLFVGQKFGDDPDAAWVRVDPRDPASVQIAIKKDAIDAPTTFLWSAWADGGLKAPAALDYNDAIAQVKAGSPLIDDEDYPLKLVRSVDNTCRKAFNFDLVGDIPGTCTGGYVEEPDIDKNPDPRVTPSPQVYDPKK